MSWKPSVADSWIGVYEGSGTSVVQLGLAGS